MATRAKPKRRKKRAGTKKSATKPWGTSRIWVDDRGFDVQVMNSEGHEIGTLEVFPNGISFFKGKQTNPAGKILTWDAIEWGLKANLGGRLDAGKTSKRGARRADRMALSQSKIRKAGAGLSELDCVARLAFFLPPARGILPPCPPPIPFLPPRRFAIRLARPIHRCGTGTPEELSAAGNTRPLRNGGRGPRLGASGQPDESGSSLSGEHAGHRPRA
jgi:hypothetical protein